MPEDLAWFHQTFEAILGVMNITVVAGGTSRGESVRKGISAIVKSADFIAVHDAARPLLTAKWIDEILQQQENIRLRFPD